MSHQREPLLVGWGMTSIAEHGLGAAHRLHFCTGCDGCARNSTGVSILYPYSLRSELRSSGETRWYHVAEAYVLDVLHQGLI